MHSKLNLWSGFHLSKSKLLSQALFSPEPIWAHTFKLLMYQKIILTFTIFQNVTVKAGRDAVLNCVVKNLGDYKVIIFSFESILFQGILISYSGEGSGPFEKLEKPVWRPKGRQLNKLRSLLFTKMKTNCFISVSCHPSGLCLTNSIGMSLYTLLDWWWKIGGWAIYH